MGNHFVYAFNSDEESFSTGGSMKSWFYWYKWEQGEDDFQLEVKSTPSVGDIIWFVIDTEVLGCASVKDVVVEYLNNDECTLHLADKKQVKKLEVKKGFWGYLQQLLSRRKPLLYEKCASQNKRFRVLKELDSIIGNTWMKELKV